MLSHHSFHNFGRLGKSIKISEENTTFVGNKAKNSIYKIIMNVCFVSVIGSD